MADTMKVDKKRKTVKRTFQKAKPPGPWDNY